MCAMASQITSLAIVYSDVYLGADQRKHESSALLTRCAGSSPVTDEFPSQSQVTRKMFPFDDFIMGRQMITDGASVYMCLDDVS